MICTYATHVRRFESNTRLLRIMIIYFPIWIFATIIQISKWMAIEWKFKYLLMKQARKQRVRVT